MSSSVYRLLQSPRSTRVIKILPGRGQDTISLELTEIDLDKDQVYDAISYTWGSDTDPVIPITINEQPSNIRQNLHDFLTRLRDQNHTQYIWVDAISIRQDDVDEKSAQVAMIGTIFQSARRILVWVGEAGDDSEILLQKPIKKRRRKHTSEQIGTRLQIWEAFLQRPYWRRLWPVQELVVGKEILLFCGPDSAPWGSVVKWRYRSFGKHRNSIMWDDIIDIDTVRDDGHTDFADTVRDIVNIIELRDLRTSTTTSRMKQGIIWASSQRAEATMLSNLSVVCKNHMCLDPRDYVYALLTFEKAETMRSFKPDYTIDLADLFINVCLAKLISWPKVWYDSLGGDGNLQKALMIVRLETRLLHSKETFLKACEIAFARYEVSDVEKQVWSALDLVLTALSYNEWSADIKEKFASVEGCYSKHYQLVFYHMTAKKMLWKTFEDARRQLEFG